jgi:hypothetical protein
MSKKKCKFGHGTFRVCLYSRTVVRWRTVAKCGFQNKRFWTVWYYGDGVRPGPCAGVHIDLKEEDGYIDETVIVCERGDIVIGCCGAMRQDDG